ncbi:MAG: O-methyltransferase [Bacteroidia bacterium]|nr:O-methyltransferase [Bacteroidia bacterium]
MNFLPEEIEEYASRFTSAEPELLSLLNRDTQAHILMPRMLSGHLQGRFLSLISRLINPKLILEIGTYTGYSALCLAEGLADDGKIYTIDINEELETMATSYFKKAGKEKQISMHVGNALEIIPALQGDFDMVFIDADKANYVNYFNLVIDRVRKGGIIIADNVLWSGHVLKKKDDMDEETLGLVKYAETVNADPRVMNILLPVRDGLMMSVKL